MVVWFFIALQKKRELDKLDRIVATKYVEHRKDHHIHRARDPKRIMQNFNKLNDKSVVTLHDSSVQREEVQPLTKPIHLDGSSIGLKMKS